MTNEKSLRTKKLRVKIHFHKSHEFIASIISYFVAASFQQVAANRIAMTCCSDLFVSVWVLQPSPSHSEASTEKELGYMIKITPKREDSDICSTRLGPKCDEVDVTVARARDPLWEECRGEPTFDWLFDNSSDPFSLNSNSFNFNQ